MQSSSGTKNPPWARSNVNTNMTGMNPQIMDPSSIMSQQGMMPFQQTQAVFNPSMMQTQGGMGMSMAGQMPMNQMTQGQMYPGNVVAYPTPRAMNPTMYQNTQTNQSSSNTEQRVFTGTVTKTHNDFGFVDHDVFYQTSVCAKGIIPKVNDRVLVEATYNPNMPFKWNATRVQVLPKSGPNKPNPPKSNSYNAVPPPANKKSMPLRREERPPRREERKRSRTRSRTRSPRSDRRDSRNRRDSPPRKRPAVHQPSPVKYVVRVPRMPLDIKKMDVPALSQRYNNLYVPSDFFNAQVKWGETFPPHSPFSLNHPCGYHIMNKEIESPHHNDAVLEPPDADYRFSAKVMLISMPTLESLYQKCGLTKSDDKEKRSSKTPLHPTRLIKFLVGQKGKGSEYLAIGGPWSPSLDGENPDSDPKVLVKTAIRTCKSLTGIDLSSCTQWYRMVEFYYWREGSGGNSRLESVVLFLPDVWSAQPSRIEWTTIQEQYKATCDAAIKKLDDQNSSEKQHTPAPSAAEPAVAIPASADKSQIEALDANDSTITIEEDEDEAKPEPTHHSKIDLRSIKVDQLRQELRARNVSCKGLRAQLISRLSKLLKAEEQKEGTSDDVMELEDDEVEDNKNKEEPAPEDKVEEPPKVEEKLQPEEEVEQKSEEKIVKEADVKKEEKTEKQIEEEKRKLEKEKQTLKSRYDLPSSPHVIVHPSTTAKGGKFGCNVATLSLMLDYRITDNKEHSFELFVFAELFNEMLMRDFGFYIYKTLYTLPEKVEEVKSEEKDDKNKKEDKKSEDKKEEKKDEKREDKEKKDDKREEKRDEKREGRRRERRDSVCESERSGSPRRGGVVLPADPYLLLALVHFDTSRAGAMPRRDLLNLFMSLGLQLSRSQIRPILDKVCVKDLFNYKSLMQSIKDLSAGTTEAMQDLPLDSTTIVSNEVPTHITDLETIIATGNRELLPVFDRPTEDGTHSTGETKDISDSGVVMYKARVVDVGALVAGAARAAASVARLEAALDAARAALKAARAAAASTQQAEHTAQHQLADITAALAAARARVVSLTASSKIFHSALKQIQQKVEGVVNIKYEDDDVVEIVNGPTKSEKGRDSGEEEKNNEEIAEDKKDVELKHDAAADEKSEDNKHTDNKDTDNISTENMEIDDKE